MHISDARQPTNTILTKCSKMTEDKHKRHGMNGNADGVFVKEEFPKSNNSSAQGGRLKFFKDGKFILEIESTREGERFSWVSVPRKTFWPPQGTAASTPTYRQESSTSLSVSDDNSSIQSSPWQRDHSWKQTSPRRNLSKELTFYFWHPKRKRPLNRSRKRRHPRSPLSSNQDELNNKCSERTTKDSACNMSSAKSRVPRRSLVVIIQSLTDKSTLRAETVVSPRKRFLREMEKDKVQAEDGCQKRSRNKTPQTQTGAGGSVIATTTTKICSPVRINGVTEEIKPPRNCSYSITSLLAEDRSVRRSPNNSPSHFNNVTQPQYCSPSSEERLYSENVDRLRSIELSQQGDKRGYATYPHQSYLPPYIYPYSLPPYYSPGMYGRSYVVPPVYHAPPMQLPIRHDVPSCSWAVEPPRDGEHREDNIADMPLNLSKHAG